MDEPHVPQAEGDFRFSPGSIICLIWDQGHCNHINLLLKEEENISQCGSFPPQIYPACWTPHTHHLSYAMCTSNVSSVIPSTAQMPSCPHGFLLHPKQIPSRFQFCLQQSVYLQLLLFLSQSMLSSLFIPLFAEFSLAFVACFLFYSLVFQMTSFFRLS